jgi:hypothetical protein
MKLPTFLVVLLAVSLGLRAQTVANTKNVLHPLTKFGTNGISSLNQDPSSAADYRNTRTRQPVHYPSCSTLVRGQAAETAPIVAKIDSDLAASPIHFIGTINGLKGTLYVTNLGEKLVTPHLQVALCDLTGSRIGTEALTGGPLGPNESEKIEVMTTNLTAVSLKVMKLSAGH